MDPTRHQVIYIANPASAELMAQAAGLLAAERHRRVVLICDEAHLLQPDQLEELRLLTNSEMDSASPFAGILAD